MSSEGEGPTVILEKETAATPAWRRLTRGLGFTFVGLVLVSLVGLLAFGLMNKSEGESGVLRLKRDAPDFTLNLFDGGTFTLSEKRGQPVVMNIWSSWCQSCRDEAPVLERGWRDFKDRGVIFVGVNVMDDRSDAEAFMREFNVSYANGPDESGIRFDYGTTGHPETFFINRDGVIVLKYIGPLNDEHMSAYVEELLQ